MSSKEEILDRAHWDFVTEKGVSSIHPKTFPTAYQPQALLAMDEYAKQEAVEFIGWVIRTGFEVDFEDGFVKIPKEGDAPGFTPVLNRDQLYELYLQSKQIKP